LFSVKAVRTMHDSYLTKEMQGTVCVLTFDVSLKPPFNKMYIIFSCFSFAVSLSFSPLWLCSIFFVFSSMPEDNQCPSLLAGFLPSPLNKTDKTIQWYESAKQKHTASCFHALWIKLKFSSLGFRLRYAADAFTRTVFLCAMFRRPVQSNVKLSPLKRKKGYA